MMIEPGALASITAAVVLVGQDYANGIAGEAGKATWHKIKQLLGWNEDPPASELPRKASEDLLSHPGVLLELIEVLKIEPNRRVSSLVESVNVLGGKVVFAQTIHRLNM